MKQLHIMPSQVAAILLLTAGAAAGATTLTITCPSDVTVTTLQAKDPYFTGVATASDNPGVVPVTYTEDASGLTNCNATGTILRLWKAVDTHGNTNTCLQRITVIDTNSAVLVCPANVVTNAASGQCSQGVSFPTTNTVKELGYCQGFEDPNFVSNTNNQSLDWTDANSHLTRVPSGTDGITSRSGAAHAVIDSSVPAAGPGYANSGAITFLDGINSAFGSGYRVAVDVYLNLLDPAVKNATHTTGYGWDLSTSASDKNGNFLRDFIFHTAAYGPTGIVVAVDNNTTYARRNDLLTLANHAVLTNTGWYTFEWLMRNTNGVLAVDLNVRDASGTRLFTQTRSSAGDLISNVSGNPFYQWFIFVDADTLAIDNTTLERCLPVISSRVSGSAFAVGTTTVTNSATDACGNASQCTFTVTVNDTQAPTLTCPPDVTQNADSGQCYATGVGLGTLTMADNCGVANETANTMDPFPVGTNTVTWTVTDFSSNTASCDQKVIVVDAEPPVMVCPADIVARSDAGHSSKSNVTWTVTASDNCGVAGVSSSTASGSTFPVGTTIVTNIATDIHGNASTCTFTVTILVESQPPVLNIKNQGTNALISWLTNSAAYVLQETTNIVSTDPWTVTPAPIVVDADQNTVTVSRTGRARFFRLVYP